MTSVTDSEKFNEWFKQREDVIGMISLIAEASQVADDIVDEDHDKHAKIARLLSIAFVELPINTFYRRYVDTFTPLFATSIQIWSHTDDWGKDDNDTIKTFGFVYREILEQVIVMAAYLVGGQTHARFVANDMIKHYHTQDQDTVDEWLEERQNG